MIEEKEFFQKKNKFHLYKNYIRSVEKMTNEQAGELFKMILHFVNTGELLESEDPRVDSAFDFIGERLEFDTRNYVDTCQKNSENGKQGGRPKKETTLEVKPEAKTETISRADEDKPKKPKKPKKANGFSEKAKKADTETDTDTDMETETDIDTDTDTNHKTSLLLRPCSGGTGASEENAAGNSDNPDNPDELTRYGENQHLTTRGVIVQMEDFAAELVRKYWGRAACENDVEKVYDKCYMPGTLPNGEWGAVFSTEKSDLLRYAFQQAAMQNGCTWSYIEGIYKKFDERRIRTVEEAVEKEYEWQRGEIA